MNAKLKTVTYTQKNLPVDATEENFLGSFMCSLQGLKLMLYKK